MTIRSQLMAVADVDSDAHMTLPLTAGEAPAEFTEEDLDAMDTAKEATAIQYQARRYLNPLRALYRADTSRQHWCLRWPNLIVSF